jgi:hypothetical protein
MGKCDFMNVFGSRRTQKPVVKTVDWKAPPALRRVVLTSVMLGNMRCSVETKEQISLRTSDKRGCGGVEEKEMMLLVWLLRDTFPGLLERDWWARRYTGRVAVTSYGAATQAVSGCTNFAHSVWTARANGLAVKS